ncbi:MAG: hypothetical protein IJ488_02830 [Clostridia bacterium]|nr:hypothetical protein [Clostridia bacterium]
MKAKRIFELVIICLFVIIVTAIASIFIYRYVVNSDWYQEAQAKGSFSEVKKRLSDGGDIQYIKIDDGEERFIYVFPDKLFDDLSAKNYERIEDSDTRHEIWSGICITVFYEDRQGPSFFLTEDGKLYWAYDLEVECPSLVAWYENQR